MADFVNESGFIYGFVLCDSRVAYRIEELLTIQANQGDRLSLNNRLFLLH